MELQVFSFLLLRTNFRDGVEKATYELLTKFENFLSSNISNPFVQDDEGMSIPLMYGFAIVVGFVGGVLNCLIMACTG